MVPLATAIFGFVFWLVVMAMRSKQDDNEKESLDTGSDLKQDNGNHTDEYDDTT